MTTKKKSPTDENPVSSKAHGGFARAAALTPAQRKEIASRAAAARWNGEGLPKATNSGVLQIGESRIPCAVLEDGRRVLSETGITYALLGARSGASRRQKQSGTPLPLFVAPKNLRPFISDEMRAGPLVPITYQDKGRTVVGFDATVLPSVCEIWLKAREAGKTQEQQKDKVQKAEILMRGLSHVGIIALIDEATGFQDIRPKTALQAYLEMIIQKELAAWAKRFPDEFYVNIYKLRGWPWPGMQKNRYSVVAHYTRDLIYQRLAPGVLKELEQRSPKNEKGQRANKLHQWLTEDVGHPMLAQHLHSIIMFQRLAIANGHGWNRFMRTVDQVLPKKGNTLELPFPEGTLDDSTTDSRRIASRKHRRTVTLDVSDGETAIVLDE